MAESTKLSLTAREPEGSRTTRRLRRAGNVPGVIYGGDGEPSHFAVDARILRNTLAHSGAILDISIDGGTAAPVLVKDLQRHPVRGEIVHVDFLRVNMNETIHTTVVLELLGADEAPGVDRGRRALPGDARGQHRGAAGRHPGLDQARRLRACRSTRRCTLAAVTVPAGITLLDDLERPSSRRSPRRRSSRSRTRSRPRPRSWARTARRRPRATPPRRLRSSAADSGRRVLKLFASTPVDWLIVGLGNPGPGYADTPHNVGFKVADELARRWELRARRRSSPASWPRAAPARAARASALLKPQTFMNEAGRSAGPARGSYKLDLDRVLVLHDEIDLPFGEIRVAARAAGSPATTG